ncbi:MAG TPA: RodZ domain-containing protein [Gammaproteobacteria bacterium]|nr:RodZ domain-containing protein [Gammaproteobacteria bacterium]
MSTQTGPDRGDSHTALGAELRAAREQRGLSLHQASQELHIGDSILDALERGDYAELGAPIFVRGHLRGYARLLGLAEDEVLAHYEQEGDKPAPPALVPQKLDGGARRISTQLFSLLVIVLLVVLGVVWWLNRPAPVRVASVVKPSTQPATTIPATGIPAPATLQAAPVAVMHTVASGAEAQVAELSKQPAATPAPRHMIKPIELPAKSAPMQAAAGSTQNTAQPPATSATPLTRVQFMLNQASWIEVYDASGKRLYYDLAPAGENVNVSGEGPLQVFLGNAPGVSIQMDGTKFDQTPYTRADNTARFRLGGTRSNAGQSG